MFLNTKLGSLISRVRGLSVETVEREAYNDSVLSQMSDLNTESQLYDKGVLADGSATGEYAPITIDFYKPLAEQMGRDGKTDHVTMKNTGELYSSINYKYENGALRVEYDDPNDLESDYGVFAGLTDESKGDIIPEVKENIIDFLQKTMRDE